MLKIYDPLIMIMIIMVEINKDLKGYLKQYDVQFNKNAV